MAVFNEEDRARVSARLVSIPEEIATADLTADSLALQKEEREKEDSPNKKLLDERTYFINFYQKELELLDGITRTELTESILVDSVNRIINNSFFPNDPLTPLPTLPSGVWIYPIPYSNTHAIGRDQFEAYVATGGRTESDIISDINAKIAAIESETISKRATGLECIPGGECAGETPPGSGVDETTCVTNGGTWTSGPDTYTGYTIIQDLLNDLKILVQEWEDRLNNEKLQIPQDPDTTRKLENTNAVDDIDNAISVIDTWQTVQDFDTTTTLPSGDDGAACAIFDVLIEVDFEQTKLQPSTLQNLKNELTSRSSYITTRISQLSGNDYLGSVVQDLGTGSLISTEGLYGERMLMIDLRINVYSGTLSDVILFQNSINTQGHIKESAENAFKALSLAMIATKAAAPGINTKYLNFEDLSSFSAGDRIYVVADNQKELSGSIDEINGNRAKLTFDIPKKYTTLNTTRIYKLL